MNSGRRPRALVNEWGASFFASEFWNLFLNWLMNRILASLLVALCLPGFLTVGCSKASKKARHLQRAEVQFEAGDFDRAEIEYLHVLRLDRTNQVALRQLGFMAFEQGRVIRAYALLNDARRADPDNLEVRIKLATMQLAGGQGLEARDEAIWLLTQEPTNEAALMLLVDSSVSTNHLRDAAQQLAGCNPWRVRRRAGISRRGRCICGNANCPPPRPRCVRRWHWTRNRGWPIPCSATWPCCATIRPMPWPRSLRRRQMRRGFALSHPARRYYVNRGCRDCPEAVGETSKRRRISCPPCCGWLLGFGRATYQEPKPSETCVAAGARTLKPCSCRRGCISPKIADKLCCLERADKAFPRVPQVHYQMAIAGLAQNDLPGAVQSLNEALTLAPD